jgi:hypothetical protein
LLPGFLLGEIRFDGQGVVLAVAGEHRFGGGFHLVRLTLKVRSRAALGLAGVARQLDTVDGKHLTANEPLAVADEQDFLEQRFDLAAQAADKVGEGGEVRGEVASEGNEGDLLTAGPLDLPATDDAAAVGEQHNLEQHGRRVGAGAGEVVLVARIEPAQV